MIQADNQVPDRCDVVVIGAGAGGLTAAGLLSKAGLQTVVLETQPQPGGYLAGFQRQGFQFNTSIQWLNHCDPGGFVYNIWRHLGGKFPTCAPLTRIHRYKSDSFDYLLSSNPIELQDCLIKDFPDDESGIRAFFKDGERLGQRLNVLNSKTMAKETMPFFERAIRSLQMLFWAIPIFKHVRSPVEKGLRRYFSTEGAQKIFCSQESFMSVMVPIAWAFAGNFQTCPKGGSLTIALWLCDRIRSAGSKVLLNQRVERVLLNGRKEATGVLLADGNSLRARYVIAACDVQMLYEKMLPNGCIPARLRKALHNADIYHSSFSIFLGLDCDASSLGFGEEVLNLTRSDVLREDHMSGDPHRTIMIVTAPSVRDPSLAPEGKGTVMIHCPAYLDYEDNWKTGEGLARGEAYRELKKKFADILLDRIEKTFAPGLRKHIEVMEIATPVTYWRYTGNTKGSISGVKPTGRNIRAGVARYKTPVKNLLLGGHCAEYGGGVPMAVKAGANASLIVMKDMKASAYEELKDVINGSAFL